MGEARALRVLQHAQWLSTDLVGSHRARLLRVHDYFQESRGRCVRLYAVVLLQVAAAELVRAVNNGDASLLVARSAAAAEQQR